MERLAFRIWDPENKTFHHSGSTPTMLAGYFDRTKLLVTVHGMKHEHYIGISDDNRLDIYEGDYLRCKKYIGGNFAEHSYERGYVEFICGAFGLHRKQGFYRPFNHWFEDYELEIIGNIHENPELLG